MKYLTLLPVLLALCTCQQKQDLKYPYTLIGFPGNLRPYFNAILNEGMLGDKNLQERNMIDSLINDTDLMKLINSEHPVFRSVGLDIVKDRKHLDHFNIIMNHLDDTALVSWYFQCNSFPFVKVSDYMIMNYAWKSEEQRTETIHKILYHHNYLNVAYKALPAVSGKPEFYPVIRQMANRDIDPDLRSRALLALAAFKKQEDKILLLDALSLNIYNLNSDCFKIMEKYPSPEYLPILEKYFKYYYREWCKGGIYNSNTASKLSAWLSALVSYNSPESAAILQKIIYRKPFLPCSRSDTNWVREKIYKVIASNPNPLYKKMSTLASEYLEEENERNGSIEIDMIPGVPIPFSVRWEYY